MSKILLAVYDDLFPDVFADVDLNRILALYDPVVPPKSVQPEKEFLLSNISNAEIVVTSWRTTPIDADVMAAAPNLRLLVHAAGSVKPVVSDALWDAGVRVVGVSAALACGVAEFALGLILTSTKKAFWAANGTRQGLWRPEAIEVHGGAFEIFRQKIGIVGVSNVGRELIRLLKNFTCDLLIYDPYCTSETAETLGVRKVESLDELFSECRVVSLCAPSTEETKGMIRGSHLALLQDGAVFVNTARNSILNEAECIEELRKDRFVACIDVTDPDEPCPLDHPYRKLPNVMLTPHMAGAVAQNRMRMGAFAADAIEAYSKGHPLLYEIKREQLFRIG